MDTHGRFGLMGPTGDQTAYTRDEDRQLQAAREAFPEWDITPVFGGYLAVPRGTPVVQGMFVEAIVEKIRRRLAQD
jgi:hypothetical protein